MHEEIETASDLYEQLGDQKSIGIANVKYIDDVRLANRQLDYLPVEVEKMEISKFLLNNIKPLYFVHV